MAGLVEVEMAMAAISRCHKIIQKIGNLQMSLKGSTGGVRELIAKATQAQGVLDSLKGMNNLTPNLLAPLELKLENAQKAVEKFGSPSLFGRFCNGDGEAVCRLLVEQIDNELKTLNDWRSSAPTQTRETVVDTAENLLSAGRQLIEESRYDQAITKFTQANLLSPNSSELLYHWGRALLKREDYEVAAAKFKEADCLKSGEVDTLRQWGLALSKAEDNEKKQEAFDKLWAAREAAAKKKDDSLAASILFDFSSVLRSQDEEYAAEICLAEAAVLDPGNPKVLWEWGIVLYDQDKECLRKFEKAYEMCRQNPKGLAVWSMALVHHCRESEKLTKDEVTTLQDEALQHCKEATGLQEKNAQALHAWGMVLSDREQFEEAVQKFSESVAADDEILDQTVAPNHEWGKALSALQKYEKAIEKFKLSSDGYDDEEKTKDPYYGDNLKAWAEALKALRRKAEAKEKFEEAAQAYSAVELNEKAEDCKRSAMEITGGQGRQLYITMDRKLYSKEIWEYAKQNQTLTQKDAEHLFKLAMSDNKISEVEHRTFDKILQELSLKNDASNWLIQKLKANPPPKKKKTQRHPRKQGVGHRSRSRSPRRETATSAA